MRTTSKNCVEALSLGFALFIAGCASAPPPPPPAPVEAVPPAEAPVPERATQQFNQAVALLQAGKLTDAELELKQLTLAYPDYPGPWVNLGLLYEKAGRFEEAEKSLREATQHGMPSALTYTELGLVYRQLGRFKDADSAYGEAIKIDPNYAPAHLNLGVLCDLYLQQPQRALESFERYMALSGNSDKRVATWIAELKKRVGSNPQPQTAEASP
ncbi:MAG TPA: tetratricopeptide repeat protein [Steroidobacteraceae bacterium]